MISATGATGVVVHADAVARPLHDRRPLVLLDLAVPRDVEPEAGSVPGVTLLDVDALRDPGTGDEDAIDQARRIVTEEVRRFVVRRRGDELAPLIARSAGAATTCSKRSSIGTRDASQTTPDERAAVEALARASSPSCSTTRSSP